MTTIALFIIKLPLTSQTQEKLTQLGPKSPLSYLSSVGAASRRYTATEWGSLECSESDSDVAE